MRIKEGFEMRDVCGEKVIVAHGIQHIDFSKVINLNETAAFLWEKVGKNDFTAAELTDYLCDAYEVSREQATADVENLIKSWREEGLLAE